MRLEGYKLQPHEYAWLRDFLLVINDQQRQLLINDVSPANSQLDADIVNAYNHYLKNGREYGINKRTGKLEYQFWKLYTGRDDNK